MTDDDREPLPSEWTDIAHRPTPYDQHAAAVEARNAGLARHRFPRASRVVFVGLMLLLAAVGVSLVWSVLLDPPWSDASEQLGVVSDAEARAAFDEMVTLASQQSVAAMEQLCEHAVDDCNGMSSAVTAHPESAPGPDAPEPEVLCTRDLDDEGTRLLVAEGVDGFGRAYVTQLVFSERDGDVVVEREPAFWLGIVHQSGDKFTGSVSWTAMHHPQENTKVGWDVEDLMRRARGPCMAR